MGKPPSTQYLKEKGRLWKAGDNDGSLKQGCGIPKNKNLELEAEKKKYVYLNCCGRRVIEPLWKIGNEDQFIRLYSIV